MQESGADAGASNPIGSNNDNQPNNLTTRSTSLIECRYCLESYPRDLIDEHLMQCEDRG